MNSKIIFDHIRTKLGGSQSQYDALLRILNSGAKPEDVAAFVGMGTEKAENPVVQTRWQFSQRSLDRLNGVHPDLVKVVHRALELSKYDFMVIEGLRTKEKQAEYFRKGLSETMNSYHLTGHAVDLAPLENGAIDWENSKGQFDDVADAMMKSAKELNLELTWGGTFKRLVDKPHFQIKR